MSKVEYFMGFGMSKKQEGVLREILRNNILERYDNAEYWDIDIVEVFATENKLKEVE